MIVFKQLIYRLNFKKKQLENSVNNIQREKINADIFISKYDNVIKMEISDYISISDYIEKVKLYGILEKISNSVLWNSSKQLVNKGTYYIIPHNSRLYNIWINGEKLRIDERTKVNDVIEEKIIFYNNNTHDYRYTSFKHEQDGNTFFTKYYYKGGTPLLELSKDEAYNDIYSIICNLETIKDIGNIISVDLLRRHILDDFDKKIYKRKRHCN